MTDATAAANLSPERDIADVNALDVERPQIFLDELLELVRERRLLDVVFALQEIDRIGLPDAICLRTAPGVATGIVFTKTNTRSS